MRHTTSRRAFLIGVPSAGLVNALGQPEGAAASALPASFPRQEPEIVKEVVGASHGRFDRVKELVGARPALANATWDWGFGDWETALGAASHVGRPDIARFLISHGARVDLFAATMLGWLDTVRSMVLASPGIERTAGPHGISLLAHAKAGGPSAAPVLEYLQSLPDSDGTMPSAALTESELGRYVGTFRYGNAETELVKVTLARGMLWFERQGQDQRRLASVGDHAFYPAGASAVRIRFQVDGDRARTFTVHDPEPVVTATRHE